MLLAETTSGLKLKFQVAGVHVCISSRGIIQLRSFFGSILLLFLMKVAGAYTKCKPQLLSFYFHFIVARENPRPPTVSDSPATF